MLYFKSSWSYFILFSKRTFSKKVLWNKTACAWCCLHPQLQQELAGNRKQMSLLSVALAPLTDLFSEVNLLITYLLPSMDARKDRQHVIQARMKPGWKSRLVTVIFLIVLKSDSYPGKTKVHFFKVHREKKVPKAPELPWEICAVGRACINTWAGDSLLHAL